MKLFILIVVLPLSGVILNILRKLSELERLKERFSLAVWLSKNLYRTLFSVTASIVVAYALKEQLTGLDAILLGFTIDAFIKTKAKAFKEKLL